MGNVNIYWQNLSGVRLFQMDNDGLGGRGLLSLDSKFVQELPVVLSLNSNSRSNPAGKMSHNPHLVKFEQLYLTAMAS